MIVVGVDPGITAGGLAAIATPAATHVDIYRLEGMHWLADLLETYQKAGPVHVALEKACTHPRDGRVGAFNYGQHVGEIRGVLVALKIPFTEVSPKTWQKVMHVGTQAHADPKQRSFEAAGKLFPTVSLVPERGRKPHSGLADALLIAEWCRRSIAPAGGTWAVV